MPLAACALFLCALQAPTPTLLRVGKGGQERTIARGSEDRYAFDLKEDGYYAITVEQKGVDVAVRVASPGSDWGPAQDAASGPSGTEEVRFSPAHSGRYLLSVRTVDRSGSPAEGRYAVRVDSLSKKPAVFPLAKSRADFDLLVDSLREAHAGLYWYSTEREFEAFCASRRRRLRDGMSVLDFYRVVAPVVAFTREGHTSIRLPEAEANRLRSLGRYLPLNVRFLAGKAYVVDDASGLGLRGQLLTKVDGQPIEQVVARLCEVEPDDGFIETGKLRWIEQGGFAAYYLRVFGSAPRYAVEVRDEKTGRGSSLVLPGVRYAELVRARSAPASPAPPARIEVDPATRTAVLTIDSFGRFDSDEAFRAFVDDAFAKIRTAGVESLVLDLRRNGGGAEGYEDYVFSFLTREPYTKYRYVQASTFRPSFLAFTDRAARADALEATLRREHAVASDGRLLRKPGVLTPAAPRPDAFQGDLYVLTSGLTYSGGAELAALIRGHRKATFVGEETGGGYYGNSSGLMVRLTLPNTGIVVRIPLLKFVLDVAGDTPFGRGVIPDLPVQPTIEEYLDGTDAEMRLTKAMIQRHRAQSLEQARVPRIDASKARPDFP